MPRKPRRKAPNKRTQADIKKNEIKFTPNPTTITNLGTIIMNKDDPELISKWPKLNEKLPEIFLHKPVKIEDHVHKLSALHISFHQPHLGCYYTKITCPTIVDYSAMIKFFNDYKLPYNTFSYAHKHKMKIVIREI